MKENKNGFIKINEEDSLSFVAGGTSVVDALSSDSSGEAGRAHSRSMSAGADAGAFAGIPGRQDASSAGTGGQTASTSGTVMLDCAHCGIPTPHMVFSGGRVKCTICNTLGKN